MSWGHDPELPAGYQDADLELAEANAHADAVRASGECPHWSYIGYRTPPVHPDQVGLRPGQNRCHNCGAVFTDGDLDQPW